MSDITLVVGDKATSSWSLRPWILLKMAGIPFREVNVRIQRPDSAEKIRVYSPSGRVPCLIDGEITVWDSISICEYVAETFPDKQLWPADRRQRAIARSISAEMHSGFGAMRAELSMNIAERIEVVPSAAAKADIARVTAIWRTAREAVGTASGPFLFGAFSVADAMYAPVATRFRTYGVDLDAVSAGYRDALLSLPPMEMWLADARNERAT